MNISSLYFIRISPQSVSFVFALDPRASDKGHNVFVDTESSSVCRSFFRVWPVCAGLGVYGVFFSAHSAPCALFFSPRLRLLPYFLLYSKVLPLTLVSQIISDLCAFFYHIFHTLSDKSDNKAGILSLNYQLLSKLLDLRP